MTYAITYGPRNNGAVMIQTATAETAIAALAVVQKLEENGEKTTISDDSGRELSQNDLRALATEEANRHDRRAGRRGGLTPTTLATPGLGGGGVVRSQLG
jgi:hypothetical protein